MVICEEQKAALCCCGTIKRSWNEPAYDHWLLLLLLLVATVVIKKEQHKSAKIEFLSYPQHPKIIVEAQKLMYNT
jgi:hypothetical protein